MHGSVSYGHDTNSVFASKIEKCKQFFSSHIWVFYRPGPSLDVGEQVVGTFMQIYILSHEQDRLLYILMMNIDEILPNID